MKGKQDLRVIKTQNNIKTTFIRLLEEKNFNSITVQNILDEALINRKTFYNHFYDKYDLAEKIINEFLEEFSSFIELRSKDYESMENFLDQVEIVYKKIYEQKKLILAVWNINTEKINFYDSLQNILQVKYKEYTILRNSEDNIQFQSLIFSTIVLTSLKHMLESNRVYRPHEVWSELEKMHDSLKDISFSKNNLQKKGTDNNDTRS